MTVLRYQLTITDHLYGRRRRGVQIGLFAVLLITLFIAGQANAMVSATGAVSAGVQYTCAIESDGNLLCWKYTLIDVRNVPEGSGPFTQVATALSHTCGIESDGNLLCWIHDNGWGDYGQTAVPEGSGPFTQVSAGYFHTCGIESDGDLLCWGGNGFDFGQTDVPEGSGPFTQVSAGLFHTCGIESDGDLLCWGGYGEGDYGQTAVPTGSGPFTQVSAGAFHTCAIESDGDLLCWGWNDDGQTDVPTGSGPFTQVSAGWQHTCGIESDGNMLCWGWSLFYDLVTVPEGSGPFTQVAAGSTHTCGIESDGDLVCWGEFGQLDMPEGSGLFGPEVDSDNDGVDNADDVCAGTVLPQDRPVQAKKNRFYADGSGQFVDGAGTLAGISVSDTGGCSGIQIIEALGLGQGHVKQGITRGALEEWMASLP